MKISKKDFEAMKAKYDSEVKKGKPAQGKLKKDKDNQTDWVFFDKETLEELLAKVDKDPKVGGIQFFITEYTDETARKVHPKEAAAYVGQMTLVMFPANLEGKKVVRLELDGELDEYECGGVECPYICEAEPSDS